MRIFNKLVILLFIGLSVGSLRAVTFVPDELNAFQEYKSVIEYCQECYEIIKFLVKDDTGNITNKFLAKINENRTILDKIDKLLKERQNLRNKLGVEDLRSTGLYAPEYEVAKNADVEEINNKLTEAVQDIDESRKQLINFVESLKTAFFRIEILRSDFVWQPERGLLGFLYKPSPNTYLSGNCLTQDDAVSIEREIFKDLYKKVYEIKTETQGIWWTLGFKKKEVPYTYNYSESEISKSILQLLYKLTDATGQAKFKASGFFRKPAELNWWIRVALTDRPSSSKVIHNFLKLKAEKTAKVLVPLSDWKKPQQRKPEGAEWISLKQIEEKIQLKLLLKHYLNEMPEFTKDEVARCLAGLLKREISKL